MTGLLGSPFRVILCRLGHLVEKVAIIETIAGVGGVGKNLTKLIPMVVVLRERNEGMDGMNPTVTSLHMKVLRPGSRGASGVWPCSTERISGGKGNRDGFTLSARIL